MVILFECKILYDACVHSTAVQNRFKQNIDPWFQAASEDEEHGGVAQGGGDDDDDDVNDDDADVIDDDVGDRYQEGGGGGGDVLRPLCGLQQEAGRVGLRGQA